MSVLLQNSTIWNRTTAAPSHTMPFDTSGGGSNLALGVSLAYYSPGGDLATSVTYGGDPLTKRVEIEDADGNRCEFWTRPNIQTGPELNVVVTFNFSADPVICARSVQNVDQTTEVSHVASGTKASNSSLDIVSASGELVLDMVAGYGTGTPVAGDTMGSHASWATITPYSNATDPAWTKNAAASAGAMSNSSSKASFTINASATVYGSFLKSDNTKGGTTGTLYGVGDFAAPRAVEDTDVLNVQVDISAAAA